MNKKTKPYIKPFTIALLLLLHALNINAQELRPRHALQLSGGYTEHGSGDMTGIAMGAEYINFIKKRIFLNYNLRTTIHNSKHEIILNNTITGTTQDASIRFTTGGVQLGVDGGYSFVRSNRIDAGISLGGFVRYQSASNGTDGYSLYGPSATGLPLILVEYANKTPQQTTSVGGALQVHTDVNISRHMYTGVAARIQTDTEGDGITFIGLRIGRRF